MIDSYEISPRHNIMTGTICFQVVTDFYNIIWDIETINEFPLWKNKIVALWRIKKLK